MEEEDQIIIQVIFKFEDGRWYSFDVDHSTTLHETKKILSNAAHVLKSNIILYHEGQEYSKEYDEQTLQKIFPTLKKIEFYLKLKKSEEDTEENEHEQISVKYNIKEPCKEHIGKFLVLYCISCKKSICNECFSISHNNHEVEEKADYLMPAKILMERIFANSFMFKSDPKISNYMSCVSFRSIIKTEIFNRMRQLINELENKCINCLEFFSFNEDSTEKNNDLNLELLKKYCTSSYIKLKNNIDTKDILINDEVFLSLYNKLKAIKEYEISLFNENSNKYKMLNSLFLPFTQEIKNMSMDLNNILTRYINKDIYAKFKEEVSKNIVDVVQKEDVVRFMFENVNIPKRKMSGTSLLKPEENCNKNSLTPNINNQRILPSILMFKDTKNNNINNKLTMCNNNINSINTSNTSSNLVNSSLNYQQFKQQNFTISSPINFKTSSTVNNNMNVNTNSSSIHSLNNINTMNNNNINNTINSMGNYSFMSNIKSSGMNLLNNNTNNMSPVIGASLNSLNKTNTNTNTNVINNMNSSTMNNINSMNTLNNTGINNLNSINSMSNIHNTNSMTNINNMNSTNNSNTANTINTNNSINNINTMNNMSSVNNMNSMNNMSSVNNMNAMNNMNTVNNTNTNTMSSMKSFLFVQNISEINNHKAIGAKEEKEKKTEKMEVEESGETPPTQNSPNIKNSEINYFQAKIDEIKANLTDKNIYTSPILGSKKTLLNVHLSPPKKEDFDNKSILVSSNYIQQKTSIIQSTTKEQNTILESSNTIKSKIETQNAPKNSINNASIFSGKLIDVLNNEKNNNINNITNSGIFSNATEKKEEITMSQKNQNLTAEFNSNVSTLSNNGNNSTPNGNNSLPQKLEKQEINANLASQKKSISVHFMYPVFKKNIIKGAIDKVTVQEMKIIFSEFDSEDPVLTEFPSGGAYCNYDNCLYFSGGQEYIKEASKLFLSVSKNDQTQIAKKLPSMKHSHWNHSMVANKDKIYVIGGYNSNKCEVYDIPSKTWTEIPDLKAPERQRSMLFVENNFLYCFMGLSQNGILDTVERLNLENIEAGWENIIVDNTENVNLKFYGAGIIRMTQANKIFFIGGKKEKNKEEIYKKSIYEFSFDDFKMTVSDFKIENDLEFVENKLYPIDDSDCGNFINVGDGFLISMPSLVK